MHELYMDLHISRTYEDEISIIIQIKKVSWAYFCATVKIPNFVFDIRSLF